MKTTKDEEMKLCSGKTEGLAARLTMEDQGESATLHVVIPFDVWQELTRVSVVAESHANDSPEVEVSDLFEVEPELTVLTKRANVGRSHGMPQHVRVQRMMKKGILPSSVWSQIFGSVSGAPELWTTPGKAPPCIL